MKAIISGIAAAATIAGMSFGGALPANAASQQSRQSMVMQYCDTHPRDNDCYDFNNHHHRWDNSHYQSFYRNHRSSFSPGAAGIFGFIAGAVIGGAVAASNNNDDNNNYGNDSSDHVAACEARFHSYNVRTDKYLGFDGAYHFCTL